MKRSSLKKPLTILLAVLLLGGLSCTTLDNPIELVGTIRLFPTAGGSEIMGGVRAIDEDHDTPLTQYVTWNVTEAVLTLDGRELDLLAGEDQCVWMSEGLFVPTVLRGFGTSPPEARCSEGVILGATEELQEATARVTLTMELRRHTPYEFFLDGDFDGDGILHDGDGSETIGDTLCNVGEHVGTTDCDDNCPYAFNPDQTNVIPDGSPNSRGDACDVEENEGEWFLDSDGDGVSNNDDNCDYTPNFDQLNPADITATDGTTGSDGLGEACQQTAIVNGGASFTVEGTVESFDIPEATGLLLVVDLRQDVNVICDWDLGTCTVDPAEVGLCVRESTSEGLAGCTTAR